MAVSLRLCSGQGRLPNALPVPMAKRAPDPPALALPVPPGHYGVGVEPHRRLSARSAAGPVQRAHRDRLGHATRFWSNHDAGHGHPKRAGCLVPCACPNATGARCEEAASRQRSGNVAEGRAAQGICRDPSGSDSWIPPHASRLRRIPHRAPSQADIPPFRQATPTREFRFLPESATAKATCHLRRRRP